MDVSAAFTNKAIDQERPLTVMQALKLAYIAQGFHLALTGKPFFKEEAQAWKRGPVLTDLYRHIQKEKMANDEHRITKPQSSNAKFNRRQIDILNVVFGKYASLEAWHLSHLTHKVGTPWHTAYDEKEPKKKIDINSIKSYFKDKIVTEHSFDIQISEVPQESSW